jgi:hypothetical protein
MKIRAILSIIREKIEEKIEGQIFAWEKIEGQIFA